MNKLLIKRIFEMIGFTCWYVLHVGLVLFIFFLGVLMYNGMIEPPKPVDLTQVYGLSLMSMSLSYLMLIMHMKFKKGERVDKRKSIDN